jgi:hypothetical protein
MIFFAEPAGLNDEGHRPSERHLAYRELNRRVRVSEKSMEEKTASRNHRSAKH